MGATWRMQKDGREVTGAEAVKAIGDAGETWFECEDGRLLSVTTNGKRALVMLLREAGDEGEHAIDPDQSENWRSWSAAIARTPAVPGSECLGIARNQRCRSRDRRRDLGRSLDQGFTLQREHRLWVVPHTRW
jgi:hypothetical protein